MTGTPLDHFAQTQIFTFMLVFSRTGTAILLMPGFGEISIPSRIRLVIALAVSLAIFPLTPLSVGETPTTLMDLIRTLIVEFSIGAYLGASARIIFALVQTSGQLIGSLVGLTALVPPPASGMDSGGPVANLIVFCALNIIFASGLHMEMIESILGTYVIAPPGTAPDLSGFAQSIAHLASETFMLAVQFATPFIVLSLLFNVALGLVNRVMPSLPVYFVGTPIVLIGGLFLVSAIIGVILMAFLHYFADWLQNPQF